MKTKNYINELEIYVDGCSKGNPGPSGVGIVIIDSTNPQNKQILFKNGYFIEEGDITNQDAEFWAVIKALDLAANYCVKHIKIYSDSQLVIKELNREFRIHKEKHRKFVEKIRNKEKIYEQILYIKVPRTNKYIKIADKLATESVVNTMNG